MILSEFEFLLIVIIWMIIGGKIGLLVSGFDSDWLFLIEFVMCFVVDLMM